MSADTFWHLLVPAILGGVFVVLLVGSCLCIGAEDAPREGERR